MMFLAVPDYLTAEEFEELLWLWNVLYPLTHVTDALFAEQSQGNG